MTGSRLQWAALFIAAFAAGPARAEWRRAASAHFTVYSAGPKEELARVTQRLERFDEVMRSRMRLPQDDGVKPLTVFLVKNQAAVAKAMGYSSDEWTMGYYSARAEGAVAVAPLKGEEEGSMFGMAAEPILFHEYTHHMMLQYVPGIFSRWYSEGIAELYSTIEFGPGDVVTIGKPVLSRMPVLRMARATPFDRLLAMKPGEMDEIDIATLYSKGWLLTHFISFNKRYASRLPAYAAALGAGRTDKAAIESAFGVTVTQLDRELKAYFLAARIPFLTVTVPVSTSGKVTVAGVSAAEEALMPDYILHRSGPPDAQLKPLASRVRRVSDRFPADLFAQRLAAETAFAAGRLEEATKAASAALGASPEDARALLIKGRIGLAQLEAQKSGDSAAWQAARALVVRANRADPDDPWPLVTYFRSFAQQGLTPTLAASQGIARASELAPQDDKVRLMHAEDLARRRDFATAITTIRPVAARPHETPEVKKAVQLLSAWQKLVAPPPETATTTRPTSRSFRMAERN